MLVLVTTTPASVRCVGPPRGSMNDPTPTQAPQPPQAEEQHQQMAHFGITVEQKTFYHYQGYVYERLADALAYAEIDTARGTLPQTNATIVSTRAQS